MAFLLTGTGVHKDINKKDKNKNKNPGSDDNNIKIRFTNN